VAPVPVADVLQKAAGRNYGAAVAAPQLEPREPQKYFLAAARFLANLLRALRRVRRPNLPFAQLRLGSCRPLPRPRFRDFLRRRDKSLI
jgi:hypothetical protein